MEPMRARLSTPAGLVAHYEAKLPSKDAYREMDFHPLVEWYGRLLDITGGCRLVLSRFPEDQNTRALLSLYDRHLEAIMRALEERRPQKLRGSGS